MSGEGSISDIRATDGHPGEGPIVDMRSIAARLGLPPPGIALCGSRFNGVGSRGLWQVLATVRGDDGARCQVALTPERARELADELVELADILEGKRW
jgi:hypothetical protein